MPCRLLVLILVAAATLAGPEPAAAGDPAALTLQPTCAATANRRASGAALVVALRKKHWIIRGADLQDGRVAARACRPRICVTIDATVDEQGRVSITATKRRRDRETVTDLPRNWERHLTQAYASYSCYEPQRLFDLYDRHRYPRYADAAAAH